MNSFMHILLNYQFIRMICFIYVCRLFYRCLHLYVENCCFILFLLLKLVFVNQTISYLQLHSAYMSKLAADKSWINLPLELHSSHRDFDKGTKYLSTEFMMTRQVCILHNHAEIVNYKRRRWQIVGEFFLKSRETATFICCLAMLYNFDSALVSTTIMANYPRQPPPTPPIPPTLLPTRLQKRKTKKKFINLQELRNRIYCKTEYWPPCCIISSCKVYKSARKVFDRVSLDSETETHIGRVCVCVCVCVCLCVCVCVCLCSQEGHVASTCVSCTSTRGMD